MNTSIQKITLPSTYASRLAAIFSPETQEIMSLGQSQGWNFTVLGQAPMLEESIRLGDWLMVPAHMDDSIVPVRTLERVRKIFDAGIRPKGFVMVHEAPMLLAASTQSEPVSEKLQFSIFPPEFKSKLKKGAAVMGSALAGLAIITGAGILLVAAVATVGMVLIPLAFVSGAVALDPILIAVTEDDYWVEIDRWLV